MIRLIPWPEIQQFRNIIYEVTNNTRFINLDENNNPIYDESKILPTITFEGTVKLHGTNASVSYNDRDGLWIQSREKVITTENDNAGFARFVSENKDVFLQIIEDTVYNWNIQGQETVTIFGEWCGKNIQRNVAISELEKSFFIFGIGISKEAEDSYITTQWLDCSGLSDKNHRIYNIKDYPTFNITIDFNKPENSREELEKLTLAVENSCPVAKALGVSGCGEGIVWTGYALRDTGLIIYRFKTKGDKYSVVKTKEIASIDIEKVESISAFVEYAVTEQRFNQAIEKISGSTRLLDIKRLGEVIRWMNDDIKKEESDTLTKNNLNFKEVAKAITEKTRQLFMKLM